MCAVENVCLLAQSCLHVCVHVYVHGSGVAHLHKHASGLSVCHISIATPDGEHDESTGKG